MHWHEEGGRLAAEELFTRTQEYAKTLQLDVYNTDVVVRIYGNVMHLQGALLDNGTMTAGYSLYPLIHGFNQTPLFDYVDVGRAGQENVERKAWGRFDV